MHQFATTDGILRFSIVMGIELLLIVVAALLIDLLVGVIYRWIARTPVKAIQDKALEVRRSGRRLIWFTAGVAMLAALGFNGWLIWRGEEVSQATRDLLAQVPQEFWIAAAIGGGKIFGCVIGALIVIRISKRLVAAGKNKLLAWGGLKAEPASVERFASGLHGLVRDAAWLLVGAYAAIQVQLPASVAAVLLSLAIIYFAVGIGLVTSRAMVAIVETIDAHSRRLLERRPLWLEFYDQLRHLVPVLRRCLDYALWAGVATIVVSQLAPIAGLAVYGPRLIQAIGLFFIGRVAVELGFLLIDRRMLGDDALDSIERKRRQTIVPLIKNLYRVGAWFVVLMIMLGTLGFNPMPFLAGAGVLGLVIGLGAQPLINDVLSGFFILFENLFLVGDFIEVGDAKGTVEAIDFRTTRVRDAEGRLHLLRNGDLRSVINYSKDFSNAVVRVGVAYGSDMDRVTTALREAADTLRARRDDVLADTEITGIEAFGESELTIRTSTRTKPTRHWSVGADFRRLILESFARHGIEIPFPHRVMLMQPAA